MKKPALRYIVLGVVLYLVFLITLFPATQAYRYVAEPLKVALPQLTLGGLEGSIWSGRVASLHYRKALLGEMSWSLSPFSLLFGNASLDTQLQSDEGYLNGEVTTPLSGGDVELEDLEGRLPINELLRFSPYLPVALDGTVSLDLSDMAIAVDGRVLRAEGTVIWHQAAMSAPQALKFGDLKLVLQTAEDGKISGDISDLGGPLKMEGKLTLEPDGKYRLNGTVAPGAGAPAQLAQSLKMLGKPDAKGRYRLDYSGKM